MFKVQYLRCNIQWESSDRWWVRVVKNVNLNKAVTICNSNIMQLSVVVSKGSFVIGQLCESLHHHWSGCICHGFRANGYVDLEIGLFFFSLWDFLCVVIVISIIVINIITYYYQHREIFFSLLTRSIFFIYIFLLGATF